MVHARAQRQSNKRATCENGMVRNREGRGERAQEKEFLQITKKKELFGS